MATSRLPFENVPRWTVGIGDFLDKRRAVSFCLFVGAGLLIALVSADTLVAQVGHACARPTQCSGSNVDCYDGYCGCVPGFVACGTACVNISSDASHCSACQSSCANGQSCVAGICRSTAGAITEPIGASPSVDVTGSCGGGSESHVSRSLNTGLLFQAEEAGSEASWATDWNRQWSPQVPIPAVAGVVASGDVWTASSGFSGLEYFSARTITPPGVTPYKSATGIAATTASDLLSSGKFDYPDVWAIPASEAGDGQSIAFDEGGTSLWLTASAGGSGPTAGHPFVYNFPNCLSGSPGSATCARWAPSNTGADYVDLLNDPGDQETGMSAYSHKTVVVNPCTHHALVSYLESNGTATNVKIKAVNRAGAITGRWTIPTSQKPNTNCTGTGTNFACPGGNVWICPPQPGATSCAFNRYVPRVQLATKVVPGSSQQCLLYAGWDESYLSSKGQRLRAAMAIIDVTGSPNEEPTTVLRSAPPDGTQYYASTPVASRYSDNVGWFFVATDPPYTTNHMLGYVSPTLKMNLTTSTVIPVSDAFQNLWMGDNMSQMLGGLPGGDLFVTWPEQVTGCSEIAGAKITVPYSPDACQEASEQYGIVAHETFGYAPPDVQSWWVGAGCNTRPLYTQSPCQRASDVYGIISFQTFGTAPPSVQKWWTANACNTAPTPKNSCQRASERYGIMRNVSWGFAPSSVQTWWNANNCTSQQMLPMDACQRAADLYGIVAGGTWGFATEDVKAWWSAQSCHASAMSTNVCQRASELYGIIAQKTFGFAPPSVQTWWTNNACGAVPLKTPDPCQVASNLFGIDAHATFAFAPVDVQTWWGNAGCNTHPN